MILPTIKQQNSCINKIFKGYDKLAHDHCTTNFYVYICGAIHTYRHYKRVGQRIIESIGSSIIIRSYILDMCVCGNLGLYRTAFFIHSSKCHTQMEQLIEATGTPVPVFVQAGRFFVNLLVSILVYLGGLCHENQ